MNKQLLRGPIYHPLCEDRYAFWPDGALVLDETGNISACGPWESLSETLDLRPLIQDPTFRQLPPDALLIPGFIDLHVHLPQFTVTGYPSPHLLTWLETFVFPTESKFQDPILAEKASCWFFHELLKNGTTTAAVFLTVHPGATALAFEAAQAAGIRCVMGQNLMDQNAPHSLLRPTQQLLEETEQLCHQWHLKENGRLHYAWMPRFALTSSPKILKGISSLREQYPSVYFHTHLSEQPQEIQAVLSLFPKAKDYTDIYGSFYLLRDKTLLAHGIHLSESESQRIQSAGSSLVHCPSSNFFLKSGRFKQEQMKSMGVPWGLGSDIGAGPEMSLFKVMKDAQYIQPNHHYTPHQLFYAATLGGAQALGQQDRLGNFTPGKAGDFVVIRPSLKSNYEKNDPSSPLPLTQETLENHLSRMIYLGDDRMIESTYVQGKCVYQSNLKDN
ncbi:MAG: guanine deaminase [Cyanobacteria bacterium]|nr:guanine deaminase [Cyanobacteriota bacterium]